MRNSPPLPVGPEDAAALRDWIASEHPGSAAARRAGIVLLAAEGLGPTAIAERTGCAKQTVILWRERYRAGGMAGLCDAPRSGRPATVDEAAVLARTLQPPPRQSGRWSTRLLAAELGVSNVAVANIWRTWGIWPGAAGQLRFGTEPVLEARMRAVAGLHLDAVDRVLALLVGSPGQVPGGPAGSAPAGPVPPVGPALAAVEVGPPAPGGLAAFLRRLAVPPPYRLALLAENAGESLRAGVAGLPEVALHTVPAGGSWLRIATVACADAGATAQGARSVAGLVRGLGAHVPEGPFTWTNEDGSGTG